MKVQTEQVLGTWYAWTDDVSGICVGSGGTEDEARQDFEQAFKLHNEASRAPLGKQRAAAKVTE